jgi:ribosomal protein S18 acetylase RimI-like enzyme
VHPLDNPVWQALTGPQETVAEGSSLARRFDPQVAPFAGLPDEPPAAAWDAMHTLVGKGGAAIVMVDAEPPGREGWTQLFRVPLLQMVATDVAAAGSDAGFQELGVADADEMIALVERTNPGPFAARTVELGDYLGVREGGYLVAMAGTRIRVPGYTEISAVCTESSQRGRGLGTQLVLALVGRIRERGDTPFLHVATENVNAIRLYQALGFTVRREGAVVGWRSPTSS